MKKILVTYATFANSTAEVAQAVGEELARGGALVEVLPIREVTALESYAGVVVGGPMIMGWHRTALGFLKKHRESLQRLPWAVFVMAMSLTQTDPASAAALPTPVYVDEKLPRPPARPDRLTFKERYAQLSNYVGPIVAVNRAAKPVSVGVFGGRLDYGRLPWWAVLFCMVIIQAPAGDRRNWPVIRAWAAGLPAAFQLNSLAPEGLASLR